MKRLTIILMIITLAVCSTFGVSADEKVGNTYQIENVTVVFEADSQLSAEQQENIAQLLVNPEYGVTQANFAAPKTNFHINKITSRGIETNDK